MDGDVQEKAAGHTRGAVWTGLSWTAVGVLLYVLSIGPVNWLGSRGYLPNGALFKVLDVVYTPLAWAYKHTPLHKPLGLYLHLWVPRFYDKSGDQRLHF